MAELKLDGIRVLNRTDTCLNWKTRNPILGKGEIGFESDTNRSKMGDGTSTWNEIPYTNSCEVAGITVSHEDETPKILHTFPEDSYINVVSVTIDEAWDASTTACIGIDTDNYWVCSPNEIDLSEEGLLFEYKVAQKVSAKTTLKLWLNRIGDTTSGKLTINIK